MDLKKLLGLRPKGTTPADIEAAIVAARAAREAVTEAVGQLTARRVAMMLDGTPEEVTAAEQALATARAEAERAAMMVPALEAKRDAAQREAHLAEVAAKVRRANEAADVAAKALSGRYGELVELMVRDVLRPEVEAMAALEEARRAVSAAHAAGLFDPSDCPAALVIGDIPRARAVGHWVPGTPNHQGLAFSVVLPVAVGTGSDFHWYLGPVTQHR